MTDEQMAHEVARMLDTPIDHLRLAQTYFRDGNHHGAFLNFAMAKAFLDNLAGSEGPVNVPSQEQGYDSADNAIEYAKGVGARFFKAVLGVDPRDDKG